ncbi:uncharacterized protein KNAG_0K00780 [Huiozyma naganishii CBS 8797]|uniref:PA14 domain-containing protein n=1 Tax=Huiozyma naganishii (strain ATCC MYA-139 / BCRC 22969 / CBS 8797 / KCTC 17520 / NBRC 10181 / NCYC 3082 / Yp74L-3) TaxID=1071383 RepID=J7RC24_HUIN7|nr:hypothetical protein KNAG_0K00780 [Kazachstania naganishii CBS 8797]CCK72445.1 hypothetical protein KNAG_0K00780 [Kazachstania naganishii CBS 8797]
MPKKQTNPSASFDQMKTSFLLLLVVTFTSLVSANSIPCIPWQFNPPSCKLNGSPKPGFTARFFHLPINQWVYMRDPSYFANDYRELGQIGEVSGITKQNFVSTIPCIPENGNPTFECYTPFYENYPRYKCGDVQCSNSVRTPYWNNQIYGFQTTVSNVTVELTGYLKAPQTGPYTMIFSNIDDVAYFFVGSDTAFGCCNQDGDLSEVDGYTMGVMYPYAKQVTFNMVEGQYYPIRIVYSNAWMSGTFESQLQLPLGNTILNWGKYVYTYEDKTCKNPSSSSVSASSTSSSISTSTVVSVSTSVSVSYSTVADCDCTYTDSDGVVKSYHTDLPINTRK